MEIRVRYKRKLPLFVLLLPFGLFIGIATFVFSGDSDFMYLYSLNRNVSELLEAMSNSDDYDDAGDNEDYLPSFDNETGTGTTAATNGSGLNLLLINNIQTECFVKEYLSICAENENGLLDTTVWGVTATTESVIGINMLESGFYAAGDSATLPKTDLPQGSDGTPVWDGDSHSLKKWNKTNHSSGGGTAAGGPLQYISDGKLTSIPTKSKYNTGTSTGGGKGDCYLFPDAVCGLNNYIASGLNTYGSDATQYAQQSVGIVGVISHNRGAGGVYMLYGVPYDTILHKKTQKSFVSLDSDTDASKNMYLQEIYSDIATSPDTVTASVRYNAGVTKNYVSYLIPMFYSGWNASTSTYKYVSSHYTDGLLDIWNAYFPNEAVSTKDEFLNKVAAKCSKLSDALGISDADCDSIYGTVNGDYPDYYSDCQCGTVYKVTEHKSAAYKHGESTVVFSIEGMCANHVYTSINCGSYVYAKMLKYAGVDVDPTDPSTYMNQYSGEWTPSTSEEKEVYSTLQANGLDTSQLNENRAKVVIAAAGLVGITYHQCRGTGCNKGKAGDPFKCDGSCYNDMDAKPTHLDCSAFVWRAYADAGFDMKGFPTGTSGYPGSLPLEQITFDDLKPGDLICNIGTHVMMYLGKSSESVYTVEAHEHGTLSGYTTRSIRKASNASVYTYYRYPGIDG